jgi:protein-S-isoprenylcysteine O-methyltransferase Ste14
MQLFPSLHLGWLNGWVFLPFLYLSTEGLAKMLPKDISPRLFDHSAWTRRDETIALLAGIPTLAYFALLTLTPLNKAPGLLAIGVAIFIVGSAACAHSIWMFARTPAGQPVTRGLYRISRNPQTVGMFVGNVGACIAIGSWIALAVVLVWKVFLHLRVLAEERTCLAKYGDSYRQFVARVPRYLLS